MHFLLNDKVLEVGSPAAAPREISSRAANMRMADVLAMLSEEVIRNPHLAQSAPTIAARAATLLMLKEPQVNAALYVLPAQGGASEVSWRFASVDPLVMHDLVTFQERGGLTPAIANALVWKPAQTAASR